MEYLHGALLPKRWDIQDIHINRISPRTSIFEVQPSKTRPFPIKTRVIWVLGIYHHIRVNVVGPSGGEHRYVYLQTHTFWSFRQMNSSLSSSRCLALWCPQCTQPSVFNSAHLPLVITNPNSHVFSMRTFRLTKVSQSFPRGRSKNAMVINFLRFFFCIFFWVMLVPPADLGGSFIWGGGGPARVLVQWSMY